MFKVILPIRHTADFFVSRTNFWRDTAQLQYKLVQLGSRAREDLQQTVMDDKAETHDVLSLFAPPSIRLHVTFAEKVWASKSVFKSSFFEFTKSLESADMKDAFTESFSAWWNCTVFLPSGPIIQVTVGYLFFCCQVKKLTNKRCMHGNVGKYFFIQQTLNQVQNNNMKQTHWKHQRCVKEYNK